MFIAHLPRTCWQWVRPLPSLRQLKAIKSDTKTETVQALFKKAIQDAITYQAWGYLANEIAHTIGKLSPERSWELLETISREATIEQHPELREALASLIRLEKMEEILRAKNPNYAGLEALLEADIDPDNVPIEAPPSDKDHEKLESFVKRFTRFLSQLIQPLTEAFSRARTEFSQSIWESFLILQVYTKILMIPYLIFQAAMILIAPLWAALLVGGVVVIAVFAAAIIYAKFFQGPPDRLPLAENFAHKEPRLLIGRQDEMQQILDHLIHAERKCVFVVAPSGTGKTHLVEAMVPLLKENGMELHKYDPGALANKGSAFKEGCMANDIERFVEGYEKNIVHYFDELGQIGALDRLQRLIDKGHRVIVSTTPEDLEKAKKTVPTWIPFTNRYKEIYLKVLTDSQVLDILFFYASALPIDKETLKFLITQCEQELKGGAQPITAIQVLHHTVRLLEAQWGPHVELEETVRKQRQEKGETRFQSPWELGVKTEEKRNLDKHNIWRSQIAAQHQEISLLRKAWAFEMQKRMQMAQESSLKTATEAAKVRYLLQTCFVTPSLRERIHSSCEKYKTSKVSFMVTQEMVGQVIAAEKEKGAKKS